jgi:hypothetical protein
MTVGCVCGSLTVEAFMGGSNGHLLDRVTVAGRWWGAATGLIVGMAWSVVMICIGLRIGAHCFVCVGALLGAGAGRLYALLLHEGVARAAGCGGMREFEITVLISTAAGVILGVIGSFVCRTGIRIALKEGLRASGASDPAGGLGKDVSDP